MKKNLIALIFLAVSSINTGLAQELIDKIVAIVENETVTQRELSIGINRARQRMAQQGEKISNEKALVAQVLQQIITRKLQLQEAQRLGIKIDEITLDRALEQLAQRNKLTLDQLKASVESSGGNLAVFRQQLREKITIDQLTRREVFDRIEVNEQDIRNYLMTKSDKTNIEYHIAHWQTGPQKGKVKDPEMLKKSVLSLQKTLKLENIGSFEALNRRIKDAWRGFWKKQKVDNKSVPRYKLKNFTWKRADELPILIQKHLNSMSKKQSIFPVKNKQILHLFYLLGVRNQEHAMTKKQYQVRHILLQTNLLDTDALVQRRLKKIKHLIEKNDNFEYYARKLSKDPGSSFKGGNLGWNYPDNFVPEFVTAVMKAEQNNEIIGPFKTTYGWHLLEVLDVREEDVGDEMARREAINEIKRSKVNEEIRLWLLKLRENRHVEVRI